MSEDEELDALIAEASIGDEAKKLKESELGRTVLGMAEQEVLAAQEALETVDPADHMTITALQNQAKTARNFGNWITELISKGENAMTVLVDRKRQD